MRRPRKSINQINVVPYIDVMLVLLVIFMVTAPLINQGEIPLPSVGGTLSAPTSPLEIMIKADQTLFLQEKPAAPIKMSREEIIARIRERQATDPPPAVVIAADRSVRYESVVDVLDTLQRNGVKRVGLLARSRPN